MVFMVTCKVRWCKLKDQFLLLCFAGGLRVCSYVKVVFLGVWKAMMCHATAGTFEAEVKFTFIARAIDDMY